MQSRTSDRGRFITLEGPDGAGKSVQAIRLAAMLRATGAVVTLTREPGGTPLGERIREVLLVGDDPPRTPESDALLFNAARSQLVRDVIAPALRRGETVICDRFADSTIAYQGYGSGLDRQALRRLERLATGGLRPDIIILLDVPVAVGLSRRVRGAPDQLNRFERSVHHDVAFHERVRQGYLEMAADEPARWRVIDATADPAAVAQLIADDFQIHAQMSEPSGIALRINS
ncbi:MAG: dTMP kinase [Chloroflexota bacterium]|nr:dTMP kinase [Chloroflexota bacterium]